MDPTDAVVMDNFYADAGGVSVRRGSQPWAIGLAGACQTLAEYYSGAMRKLIASAGGTVYDLSATNVNTVIGSGFTSDVWTCANFSARLFMANGVDAVQAINGGSIASAAFTGPPSPPSGVFTFKGRLFFWMPASPIFYYAPLGAVTGALAAFDLSTIAQFGGNILCMTNFAHDGGDGVTNTLAIVMTTGEVLLYLGDDPGLTTNWQIVGKYKLGAPINGRSVAAYGGDVYLTTLDDHVALQEQLIAIRAGQTPPRSKISGAVREVISYSNNTATPGKGFQAIYYGKGRRVVFNVPSIFVPEVYEQHIYNTSNQSWQRFQGMNALCWAEFQTNLYFGTATGQVWWADTGADDNGQPIVANCQQAWSALQAPSGKRTAGLRPVIYTVAGQGWDFSVGYDYNPLTLQIITPTYPIGAIWDVSLWDVTYWAQEASVDSRVHAGIGSGTAVSFQLSVEATVPLVWMRTDLVVENAPQI